MKSKNFNFQKFAKFKVNKFDVLFLSLKLDSSLIKFKIFLSYILVLKKGEIQIITILTNFSFSVKKICQTPKVGH